MQLERACIGLNVSTASNAWKYWKETYKALFSFQKNFYSIRHIECSDTCMEH